MLTRAMLIGYRSGFFTDETLRLAFDVTTHGGAKALRLEDYGLVPGAKADFVALAAPHVPFAVASVPKPRQVYRAGKLIAENGVLLASRSPPRPCGRGPEAWISTSSSPMSGWPAAPSRSTSACATGLSPPSPRPAAHRAGLRGRRQAPLPRLRRLPHPPRQGRYPRALPICSGTLDEAVASTRAAKAAFTEDDVYRRAATVLEQAIAHGTTVMRSFVEVDDQAEMRSLDALLRLRAAYAHAIDLEICAFAQDGTTGIAGSLDRLAAALEAGADLVGGCPYTDSDPQRHIADIFDLAERFGTAVDFHIDFTLDPERTDLPAVIAETRRRGFAGKVALGHVTNLSMLPPEKLAPIAAELAAAGIAVVALPATDLFLTGRDHTHAVPRGLAPLPQLAAAGVVTAIATNNVLNPFTPFGDASMMRMADLYMHAAQLRSDAELEAAFDLVTANPARILGRTTALRSADRRASCFSTRPTPSRPSAPSPRRSPAGTTGARHLPGRRSRCFWPIARQRTVSVPFPPEFIYFALAVAAAGVAGGLIAGLLGVGGGIVIVPVLFTVLEAVGVEAGLAIKVAVATSLATITLTSLSSARSHHRRGAVDYTLLRRWSVPVVIGVIIGTLIAGYADGRLLTGVFGTVALLVAINMAWRRNNEAMRTDFPNAVVRSAFGVVVGLISAMMGIGGGTLSVPILTAFGFDMRRAVGTASAIGFFIAIPGTIGYVLTGWGATGLPPFSLGYINLVAFAAIAPLTMAFAPVGARIAHSIPQAHLRLAFAIFLLATAIRMFWSLLA